MREIIINTRAANEELRRERDALRKQNMRFRRIARRLLDHHQDAAHECATCEQLVRDALGEAIP